MTGKESHTGREPGEVLRPEMVELDDDALVPQGTAVVAISAPDLSARQLRDVLGGLDPDIAALAAPDLESVDSEQAGSVLLKVTGELPELLSAIVALWTARTAETSARRLKQLTLELRDREVAVTPGELPEGSAGTLLEKAVVRRIRLDID